MTGDRNAIVGRDAETARLAGFLERAAEAPAAIVLEGEAGIGKTTLWRWTLDTARACGFLVLSASPAAAETALSFAAVGDLLEPTLTEILPQLPPPRRAALSAALQLATDDAGPPEIHAIAAAVRDAIRLLAEDRPVLIAVDDAQWIDRPSAGVLAYALRRLGDTRASTVVARRPEAGAEMPFAVDRAFGPARFERLPVAELSLGALHRILVERLALTLPRPVIRRIADAAGGNPFFALEIGRALQRRGATPGLAESLPIPEELHDLLRDRLSALPAETRDLLAAAAALSAPTTSLLEAATGGGPALHTAVDAGLLTFEGERVRFSHPLLRAAALEMLLPTERRALHARLSTVVTDPEERARQLARSVDGPDAKVAASLDEAAWLARQRGASHAAAELYELALQVTPAADAAAAQDRRLRAARHTWEAGDADRARMLGEKAVALAPPGRPRAEALLALGVLLIYQADVRAASALQREALEEAADDLDLRAAAHSELAMSLFVLREALPEAEEHARLSVELAERLDAPARLMRCLSNQGMVKMGVGRADAAEPAVRALALEKGLIDRPNLVRGSPRWDQSCGLLWSDQLDEATAGWRTVLERANEYGDEGSVPYTLAHLALTRCLAGALGDAATLAGEGHELAVQAGLAGEQAMLLAVRAFVQAHLGESEACRALAADAIAAGERCSLKIAVITGRSAVALLELSLGDFARVEAELADLERELIAAGAGNPGGLRFVPDYAEALVGLGELDRAAAVINRYEAHAVRLDRPAARAAALRCRGLLAAARRDSDGSLRAFASALEQHDRRTLPIDRARTQLAHGAVLRRARRKTAARAALDDALAVFTATGAKLFADATRRELDRISGRAAATGELTPSERRVAELVAAGRTNREVAAALFVTERTIEGHLSHVYAKLGVRSRSQLATRFAVKS